MKLNELVNDLNISVEDYFLNFYDIPEKILFQNPIVALANKTNTKKLFILESNTYEEIEDVKTTFTLNERNENLFEELKSKSFYFIVKIKDEFKDKYFVADEVFTSLDEAKKYAMDFFKG